MRACEARVAGACERRDQLDRELQAVVGAVIDAIDQHDESAFARLAPHGLELRHVTFVDPGCAAKFAGETTLGVDRYPGL